MSAIFLSIVLRFVYTHFCLFAGREPALGGWFSLSEYLSIARFRMEVGIESPLPLRLSCWFWVMTHRYINRCKSCLVSSCDGRESRKRRMSETDWIDHRSEPDLVYYLVYNMAMYYNCCRGPFWGLMIGCWINIHFLCNATWFTWSRATWFPHAVGWNVEVGSWIIGVVEHMANN